MGVAVEDGGEFGGRRVEMESLEVVQHIDVETGAGRVLDEGDVGLGEAGARTIYVDVSANGGDRSDFGEIVEDGGFADVAAVQDAVDA